MKLLSIVIPAYNVEKYLADAMKPYLEMSDPQRVEVLIVNDGSKDKTLEVARRYEEKLPGIVKVIDKKNGGHGSTINVGIQKATGKYFKVVDGDDWVDTKALEKMLEYMKNINSDMIATAYNMIYEDIQKEEEVHIRNVEYGKEYEFSVICEKIEYIRMHSTIFKTSVLRENKIRLDEHCFYVDVEHDLLPLKWVKTITFYDEVFYQYRLGRPGQSVNMQSMIKNRENHERVIKRIVKYNRDNQLPETVRKYIDKKLDNMIGFQYTILFACGSGKSEKRELMEFDKWLKKNANHLYCHVQQKKILLLRKFGFRNYYFVKFLYKFLGKHEEQYVK